MAEQQPSLVEIAKSQPHGTISKGPAAQILMDALWDSSGRKRATRAARTKAQQARQAAGAKASEARQAANQRVAGATQPIADSIDRNAESLKHGASAAGAAFVGYKALKALAGNRKQKTVQIVRPGKPTYGRRRYDAKRTRRASAAESKRHGNRMTEIGALASMKPSHTPKWYTDQRKAAIAGGAAGATLITSGALAGRRD